jgi:tetratricopeptide (TPR) repeat protein
MLDHYLHTAYAAALRLQPSRRPIPLAALQPGVTPEHIGDAGQAAAWFEAEHQVLMAAAGLALEAGFDTHVGQIAWAVSRFGYASSRLGSYEDAYAHLELALGIHTGHGDRIGQAYVHNALAMTLQFQGRYDEALGQAEQALESYTAAGHQLGRALALNSVGWFRALLGDHQQAFSYCRQAIDLFRDVGYAEGEASALDSLGYAHQQSGDQAEAAACYQQALDLHRELGSRWGMAEALGHLGDIHRATGNPEAARTAWEEALTILNDLDHPDADQVRVKLAELDASP